jgi:hypothetical protein
VPVLRVGFAPQHFKDSTLSAAEVAYRPTTGHGGCREIMRSLAQWSCGAHWKYGTCGAHRDALIAFLVWLGKPVSARASRRI